MPSGSPAAPKCPQSLKVTVFKVTGETNTDDLSPAPDAWSRPDIPLHALAMLKNPRPGITPEEEGKRGPVKFIEDLRAQGQPGRLRRRRGGHRLVAASRPPTRCCGSPAKTFRSCRTSASAASAWARKIAPIFYNTMEDAGALPIELDVSKMEMGDIDRAAPLRGQGAEERRGDRRVQGQERRAVRRSARRRPHSADHRPRPHRQGARGARPAALDAVPPAAGARRTPRRASRWRRRWSAAPAACPKGRACVPGTYCEPKMTSVGSQDTTGPMTRDELKDLACLGFSADLVMQSFCHTAAYPKPVDVKMHHELPEFISTRGGVSLRPGDGVIHSWLNRHAAARHGGHRRRQPHALPDRHQLSGRLGPGRVRGRHRRHAAGHARDRCWCASRARCSPASPCATWSTRSRCTRSSRAC